jgi:mono/diheme cytochrome c family protein
VRTAIAALALTLAAGTLPACRTDQTLVTPDPHLERMLSQEKRLPYDEDPMLPGGIAMQQPPEGTLPADAPVGGPLVRTGIAHDRYADRIPVAVDRPMIEKGRRDFETFCAACHGILGDGASVVPDKMALRRPPGLNEPRLAALAPGEIFAVARQGYGLMPSYAVQLGVRDTWGVVAYVRALQLARAADVTRLPRAIRAQLAKEAP